ncbi:MAG: adenylyl-sulfate kinase [Muribaculaceae bacterium]|nr:adenylyl-sulfate kinase [Muribaculaceae bacterium]
MNHLILHIEYLLLRHDCVIVPGLGAFIATASPALIDVVKGQMLPPRRSVMFNQAVTTDDGLLTNSIARKNGISFEEARQALFHEVTNLKNHLYSEGSCQLGKIGSFLVGEENTILFSPSDAAGALSVCPGLKPLNISNDIEQNLTSERGFQVKNRKGFIRRIGKIAAAIAAVATVTVAGFLYPLPSDNREQKASVVPVEAFLNNKISNEVSAELKKDSIPTIAIKDTITKEQQTNLPSYYLIVATFKSNADAEKYAEQFSSSDFPLSTVTSRKVSRVVAATSDNKEELQSRLNSKEITSRFSNPWIWERL